MKTKTNSHLAKMALSLQAIKLDFDNPFEWASGYKMPIYNDNRLLFRKKESRKAIMEALKTIISEVTMAASVDVIAATATAGIPWGAMLANELGLEFIYIREKSKNYGLRNQIEGMRQGESLRGLNVIVIEDLISTGGSSAKAVQAVRNAGGTCYSIISIFDYKFDVTDLIFSGRATFDNEDERQPRLDPSCRAYSAFHYGDLIDAIGEELHFREGQIMQLGKWRQLPFSWGENNGFPRVKK